MSDDDELGKEDPTFSDDESLQKHQEANTASKENPNLYSLSEETKLF